MKYLPFKSMAWILAMVSTPLFAQQAVPNKSVNQEKSFIVTEVKYQNEDNLNDKNFNGQYYLNFAAVGSTPWDSSDNYSYKGKGCISSNTSGAEFSINLHLPDGHKIIGLRYYFIKDYVQFGNHSFASLYRTNGKGQADVLASVDILNTNGNMGNNYVDLPEPHYVNNAKSFYVLGFTNIGSKNNVQMCGARLTLEAAP